MVGCDEFTSSEKAAKNPMLGFERDPKLPNAIRMRSRLLEEGIIVKVRTLDEGTTKSAYARLKVLLRFRVTDGFHQARHLGMHP